MSEHNLHANQTQMKTANESVYLLASESSQPQIIAEHTLNSLFPTPAEENKIQQARHMLKDTGKSQTDEQIQTVIAEFEFLINEWLDEYEKHVFEGKTLKDLLQITF